MKRISILLCLALGLGTISTLAQEVEDEGPIFVEETFRTFRLVYGHSTETLWKNNLMFVISHRFGGTISEGFDELFGLDGSANIRLGLGYGITENLTIGLGRSSQNKVYDGYVKYRFLRQQEQGWPVSMTVLGSAAIRTRDYAPDIQEFIEFKHRVSYFTQVLMASRVFPFLSVQIEPSVTHRNFTTEQGEPNTIFALGGGVRFRITDGIALLGEYTHPFIASFDTPRPRQNVIGFGIDFSSARHSFQLQVSNTTGLIGQEYIPNTTGEFFNGDIHIGFHISRKFGL